MAAILFRGRWVNIYLFKTFWSFVIYAVIHACIDVRETYIRLQFWRLNTLFIGISIQIFSQEISNGLGRILKKTLSSWTEDELKNCITHWGRVTHICVSELTIIGSDNGLSPNRRQAIICANAGILLIRPFGINFNEMLIEIDTLSFKKIHSKMSSGKWRPFCLGLNVITDTWYDTVLFWIEVADFGHINA